MISFLAPLFEKLSLGSFKAGGRCIWPNVYSCLKGIVGVIPYAGSIIGELIGSFIPNQRIDRLINYFKLLDDRLKALEIKDLKSVMRDIKAVDLFEDSCHSAIKALTQERLKYIAIIFINGIQNTNKEYYLAKRLLQVLNELTDEEIILLGAFYYSVDSNPDYYKTHAEIIKTSPFYPSYYIDEEETSTKYTLKFTRINHLIQLGLLEIRYVINEKKGNVKIEFNGKLTIKEYVITLLGTKIISEIQL